MNEQEILLHAIEAEWNPGKPTGNVRPLLDNFEKIKHLLRSKSPLKSPLALDLCDQDVKDLVALSGIDLGMLVHMKLTTIYADSQQRITFTLTDLGLARLKELKLNDLAPPGAAHPSPTRKRF